MYQSGTPSARCVSTNWLPRRFCTSERINRMNIGTKKMLRAMIAF